MKNTGVAISEISRTQNYHDIHLKGKDLDEMDFITDEKEKSDLNENLIFGRDQPLPNNR